MVTLDRPGSPGYSLVRSLVGWAKCPRFYAFVCGYFINSEVGFSKIARVSILHFSTILAPDRELSHVWPHNSFRYFLTFSPS